MNMNLKTTKKNTVLGLLAVAVFFATLQNASAIALPGGEAISENGLFNAEQYRGKVVYLDFWASWCSPCKKSFPWMRAMQMKYEKMGLKVITINVDKKKAHAEAFLKKHPATFPVLFDPSGTLADKYQLAGMPMSYIIDRNGVIRHRHIGYIPAMQGLYEQELQVLLKK